MKSALTLMLLLSLGACQSVVVFECPPFPWPGDGVISFMDAGSKTDREVGNWWRDIVRHGVECRALKE